MKNINVFAAELPTITALEESLNNAEGLLFTPLTDNQWSNLGLSTNNQLTDLGNGYRIDFIYASKDIPKPQIKEELEKLISIMGYEPSKDEVGQLCESVTAEFCAKMIIKTVKFSAYYHTKKQSLIFDCKDSLAQSALSLLIKALGSVETKTLHCSNISNSLTSNMEQCLTPEEEGAIIVEFAGFSAGDLLVMKNEDNDIVRFKGDYPNYQVRELIEDGYEIKEINLSKDGVSFTINNEFKIKGIKTSFDIESGEFMDDEDFKIHLQALELEIVTSHCNDLRNFFDKQNDEV
jgi:DNA recombination-dependent growth factor C